MRESWVFGANDDSLGLGLNHLPFQSFWLEALGEQRLGVSIGGCVLDLAAAAPVLPGSARAALRQPVLNDLMALGSEVWTELREALQYLLSRANRERSALEAALLPARNLNLRLAVAIGDYTDFYAGRDHARRVGELFRPEKPLLDNYDWVPIGYHGRASSVVPSGTPVRRPWGQARGGRKASFGPTPAFDPTPAFGPSTRLDYELELGYFLGLGNPLGEPISAAAASGHLFGVSLMNDWSTRDIQAWEAQPLGPFLGKSFLTSVSPLVTPLAALSGVETPVVPHPAGLLRYLDDPAGHGFDLQLRVELTTEASRAAGLSPFVLSEQNSNGLFWTPSQMVAHHTSNGCNLRPGDLLGTGTISGAERTSAGCLLELTRAGAEPLRLPNGEQRGFLDDGDEVILTGFARPAGEMPLRLGECRGRVVAAHAQAGPMRVA